MSSTTTFHPLKNLFYSSFQASVKTCHLSDVLFSADEVLEALSMLKSKKSDGDGVHSEHLKFASPAIAKPLAFFSLQL